MKKKIIYSFILIFLISLISSAKKTAGCDADACCQLNQTEAENKEKNESKPEPVSLSLFFFNI